MLGLIPTPRRELTSEDCETFSERWPLLKRIRRQMTMPLFRIVDTGLFGLTPLKKHILICGFPRSGTTMLQLMLENGIPDARRFGRETGGWRAATFCFRNHEKAITKVPHDVFRLTPLRQFYAKRGVELKIILMLRDPRDVLTSRRKTGGPAGYVVSSARWRRYYEAFERHQNHRDVIIVRYEDLVAHVENEQKRIERFTGETMAVPFSQFCQVDRPDFDTSTLNGLRPIEQTLIARWAATDHHQRIEDVLSALPELPQALIDLGYESDTFWTEPYASSIGSVAQQIA
jgi:hypothetical protein